MIRLYDYEENIIPFAFFFVFFLSVAEIFVDVFVIEMLLLDTLGLKSIIAFAISGIEFIIWSETLWKHVPTESILKLKLCFEGRITEYIRKKSPYK